MAELSGIALLSLALEPKTFADAERLEQGLRQMIAEEVVVRVRTDAARGEVIIAGMDESHLEIIVDRLSREFRVEAMCGPPQVVYKETITRAADGEATCARTRGEGPSAHVKLHVSPNARGAGSVFESHVPPGTLGQAHIEAADEGITRALSQGVLHGYPVDDVHVALCEGSYHDPDATPDAFRTAASMAFLDAAKKAKPVVLEPSMRLEVVVPKELVDNVIENIASRRGHVHSREVRGETHAIRASVPLEGLFGYSTDVSARTRGRATWSIHFERYVPLDEAGGDPDRDALVGVPRKPAPTRRESSVAMPEPDDRPGGAVFPRRHREDPSIV